MPDNTDRPAKDSLSALLDEIETEGEPANPEGNVESSKATGTPSKGIKKSVGGTFSSGTRSVTRTPRPFKIDRIKFLKLIQAKAHETLFPTVETKPYAELEKRFVALRKDGSAPRDQYILNYFIEVVNHHQSEICESEPKPKKETF